MILFHNTIPPKRNILASCRNITMTICSFVSHELIETIIKTSLMRPLETHLQSSAEFVQEIVSFLASLCFGFAYAKLSAVQYTIAQEKHTRQL